MGLFLALSIIGIFLIAGISYSAWRQQQTQSEISNARKRGIENTSERKLGNRWQSSPKKDTSPENLEKALDSIKLTSASTPKDANISTSTLRMSRSNSYIPPSDDRNYQREEGLSAQVADGYDELSADGYDELSADGYDELSADGYDELSADGYDELSADDYPFDELPSDELPSDEELADAQAITQAEKKSERSFGSFFFAKKGEFGKDKEGLDKEGLDKEGLDKEGLDEEPHDVTPSSQLTLDEFGEPVPLDQLKGDNDGVFEENLNASDFGDRVNNEEHIPQVAREDVEWLNISMSYSGFVSHLSAYIGGTTAFSVEQVMAKIKEAEAQVGIRIKVHYRSSIGTSWRRLERSTGVDILEMMMSIQLADRTGSVTEAQVTRFASAAVDIAEQINRTIHWSLDIDDAVLLGEELYTVGKKFDLVASTYLYSNGEVGFLGRDIKTAATEARMQLNDYGAFEFFDRSIDPQKPLFTMVKKSRDGLFNWSTIDNEKVDALQFFMCLPYISDPKWAYDEMVRIAHSIERQLNGTLVNMQGQELTKALSDEASDGIEKFAKMMKDRGMKPGGEVAMTLIGEA